MKDLLEQVMPEFEPVQDRVDQVRRRVKARRDRQVMAGAAVAVVAVAVGGVVTVQRPSEVPAAAVGEACEQAQGLPHTPADEPVTVPLGASKVTLCVFKDPDEIPLPTTSRTPWPGPSLRPAPNRELVGAKEQLGGDGAIERKVNAMSKSTGCPRFVSHYHLVFEYPDRNPVVIGVSDKCDARIPREELLRDGDVLGWLDRMDQPYYIVKSYPRR